VAARVREKKGGGCGEALYKVGLGLEDDL